MKPIALTQRQPTPFVHSFIHVPLTDSTDIGCLYAKHSARPWAYCQGTQKAQTEFLSQQELTVQWQSTDSACAECHSTQET